MSQITVRELNKVIAYVLSKRFFMPHQMREAIGLENVFPGRFLKYHARMSSNYRILPSQANVDQVYRKTGKKGEGAKYLLLEALEIDGKRVRLTGRIVEVEKVLCRVYRRISRSPSRYIFNACQICCPRSAAL